MKRHAVMIALVHCVCSVFVVACGRQETASTTSPASPKGTILAIGDLTWPDVDALDRERTVFLLTVGMLEEHGPHLPIASDTIAVEFEARGVAERLSQALPGWNIVMMPAVNYGSSGANQVGGNIVIHPGTYGIRQSTLRSLVADIGGQVVQNRFKRVFVMNGHGAPTHHTAVNQACDFVSEVFDATMLNVSGLFNADPAIQAYGEEIAAKHFSPADRSSFGMDVHAGVRETSGMLAVRPDLVRSNYRSLPSYRVQNVTEARAVGRKAGWPGYFSSPARATEAYGRDIEAWWVEGMTDLILRAVKGENLFGRPRWPENVQDDPARAEINDGVLEPEREFERRLQRWLGEREKN